MDGFFRGLALVAFGVGATWLVSVLAGRLVTRKGFAPWVWHRSGALGRVLIAVGFGLAVVGMSQSASLGGSSLVLLGSLIGMVGIWLILPGP